MGHKGYKQGDMSPKVDDIQRPMKSYPEAGFSKTTDYVSRHDSYEGKEASTVRKQGYKGRYS